MLWGIWFHQKTKDKYYILNLFTFFILFTLLHCVNNGISLPCIKCKSFSSRITIHQSLKFDSHQYLGKKLNTTAQFNTVVRK